MAERRLNMGMGQVRWAGRMMAVAAAFVVSGVVVARADIASDKPAAILVYPYVPVDTFNGIDTIVRMTNTNAQTPIQAHCFYLDANSHCSGGTADGRICTEDPTICTGGGRCIAGWQEVDFRVLLTANQPIEWKASDGLQNPRVCVGGSSPTQRPVPCQISEDCTQYGGFCQLGVPLPIGVCQQNPFRTCAVDADCNPFPGGTCTQSNGGTRIPGVPEDPFVGELKCIAIDANGLPTPRNELKGEALLETSSKTDYDVASYNAIGIQANGSSTGDPKVLTLGGPDIGDAEYNGCPNYLILNHFFDDAIDPVPKSHNYITTNLVFVPCSEDLLRQIPGSAVVQYLVFNEFEQRFSTSKRVDCFQDIQLCNIDTPDCSRSIFNVNSMGSLTGQTRINPLGVAPLPSGLLAIAVETHWGQNKRSAAFNVHMQGERTTADTITIP
jgi:hypothetical protein